MQIEKMKAMLLCGKIKLCVSTGTDTDTLMPSVFVEVFNSELEQRSYQSYDTRETAPKVSSWR